jgi:hypothetical protein
LPLSILPCESQLMLPQTLLLLHSSPLLVRLEKLSKLVQTVNLTAFGQRAEDDFLGHGSFLAPSWSAYKLYSMILPNLDSLWVDPVFSAATEPLSQDRDY